MPIKNNRKKKVGIVVSTKNNKTITVLTKRKKMNMLYKKSITVCSKIMAHDEKNMCQVGDKVIIGECRPISKRKKWRLEEIVNKN